MGMARKSRELDAMSESELHAAYDGEAENTVVGTGYWREEILHRRQMYAAHVQLQQAEQRPSSRRKCGIKTRTCEASHASCVT